MTQSDQEVKANLEATIYESARLLASKYGFKVFPVCGRNEDFTSKCETCSKRQYKNSKGADITCSGAPESGKNPFLRGNWKTEATTDAFQIEDWWKHLPDSNIGICLDDDHVVIDIDSVKAAEKLKELEGKLGPLPETFTVTTGKGTHLYFLKSPDLEIKNLNGIVLENVDIKSKGGYIIGPSSRHKSGRVYTLIKDKAPTILPVEWQNHLRDAASAENKTSTDKKSKKSTISQFKNNEGKVPDGRRGDYLYKFACKLVGMGMSYEVVKAGTHAENQAVCDPPSGTDVVENAVNSAMSHEKETPKGRSFMSLCTENFKDPEWLINKLLPEGLTLLCGAPKTRKTWLAMDLALTIADGGVALNKFNTPRKRNVLYLALEDNARRFQKRLKLILKGKPAPDNALFFDYWKLDTEGRNHLQTMIIKQDIGFVVVDTLSKIRPRRNRQNGFIDDYSDVAILQDIARETGASILTIHHTRKGGNEGEDVFDEISGTRGLTAACDAMWVLKPRARGSLKYTLETTGRDVEDISLAIEFEDYVWSCLGEKTEVFRSENDHKILQVVSNTPIGPKEIADLTGIKVNTVKAAVCRLLQDGLISRSVKAGKYIECKNTQPDNFM